MRTRLRDRLPPHSEQLVLFDENVARVDHRRSLTTQYSKNTLKAFRSRFRHYQRWCARMGYQTGAQFITSQLLTEYVEFVVSDPETRYAEPTIYQALKALVWHAERETGQAPSKDEALGVLAAWRKQLKKLNVR